MLLDLNVCNHPMAIISAVDSLNRIKSFGRVGDMHSTQISLVSLKIIMHFEIKITEFRIGT